MFVKESHRLTDTIESVHLAETEPIDSHMRLSWRSRFRDMSNATRAHNALFLQVSMRHLRQNFQATLKHNNQFTLVQKVNDPLLKKNI